MFRTFPDYWTNLEKREELDDAPEKLAEEDSSEGKHVEMTVTLLEDGVVFDGMWQPERLSAVFYERRLTAYRRVQVGREICRAQGKRARLSRMALNSEVAARVEASQDCGFLRLPAEILLEILSHLEGTPVDIVRATAICRTVRHIVYGERRWETTLWPEFAKALKLPYPCAGLRTLASGRRVQLPALVSAICSGRSNSGGWTGANERLGDLMYVDNLSRLVLKEGRQRQLLGWLQRTLTFLNELNMPLSVRLAELPEPDATAPWASKSLPRWRMIWEDVIRRSYQGRVRLADLRMDIAEKLRLLAIDDVRRAWAMCPEIATVTSRKNFDGDKTLVALLDTQGALIWPPINPDAVARAGMDRLVKIEAPARLKFANELRRSYAVSTSVSVLQTWAERSTVRTPGPDMRRLNVPQCFSVIDRRAADSDVILLAVAKEHVAASSLEILPAIEEALGAVLPSPYRSALADAATQLVLRGDVVHKVPAYAVMTVFCCAFRQFPPFADFARFPHDVSPFAFPHRIQWFQSMLSSVEALARVVPEHRREFEEMAAKRRLDEDAAPFIVMRNLQSRFFVEQDGLLFLGMTVRSISLVIEGERLLRDTALMYGFKVGDELPRSFCMALLSSPGSLEGKYDEIGKFLDRECDGWPLTALVEQELQDRRLTHAVQLREVLFPNIRRGMYKELAGCRELVPWMWLDPADADPVEWDRAYAVLDAMLLKRVRGHEIFRRHTVFRGFPGLSDADMLEVVVENRAASVAHICNLLLARARECGVVPEEPPKDVIMATVSAELGPALRDRFIQAGMRFTSADDVIAALGQKLFDPELRAHLDRAIALQPTLCGETERIEMTKPSYPSALRHVAMATISDSFARLGVTMLHPISSWESSPRLAPADPCYRSWCAFLGVVYTSKSPAPVKPKPQTIHETITDDSEQPKEESDDDLKVIEEEATLID